MNKKSLISLVLCLALCLTACYGPFRLTKKLHQWNGEIGNKWVNEAIFLALVIIPVYEISVLADGIIFNSIEFWTGKPALSAKAIKSIEKGNELAVLSYTPESRRLRVDNFYNYRHTSTLIFEPRSNGGMVEKDGAAFREDGGGVRVDLVQLAGLWTVDAALAWLASNACDLVLLDLRMPVMDGVSLVRELRGIAPQVKVICISGAGSKAEVPAMDQLQPQAFLAKPFSTETLLTAVHEVISAR